MHQLRVYIFLVALIPCLSSKAQEMDWGSSHNLLIQYTLSEKWSLLHRSLLSTRNDFDDAFFGMADLALGYKLPNGFTVRAGYRQAWFNRGDGWLPEQRPYAEVRHLKFKNGFMIDNRGRLEFRRFDHRDNDTRFRYEIRIEGPWRFTRLGLRPYLEEEFFYSFKKEELEANWLSVGLNWKPNDNLKFKLGYRWLTQKIGDRWIHRNTIVTGVMFFY